MQKRERNKIKGTQTHCVCQSRAPGHGASPRLCLIYPVTLIGNTDFLSPANQLSIANSFLVKVRQLDTLHYQAKFLCQGVGYSLLNGQLQESYKALCTSQTIFKAIDYSPQLDAKTPVTYIIKQGEIDLVHNQKCHPY